MAQAPEDEPKWPGPVTFNDDDPKTGFSTIFLGIPNLQLKKALFSKPEPKNAELKVELKTESIYVHAIVTEDDKKKSCYVYKKKLPEDITPEKSDFKIKKGIVKLNLCKAKPESWVQYAKFFIRKE